MARFSSAAKFLGGGEVSKCCEVLRVGERAALIDWKSIYLGKESQRILQLYSFWSFEV